MSEPVVDGNDEVVASDADVQHALRLVGPAEGGLENLSSDRAEEEK